MRALAWVTKGGDDSYSILTQTSRNASSKPLHVPAACPFSSTVTVSSPSLCFYLHPFPLLSVHLLPFTSSTLMSKDTTCRSIILLQGIIFSSSIPVTCFFELHSFHELCRRDHPSAISRKYLHPIYYSWIFLINVSRSVFLFFSCS